MNGIIHCANCKLTALDVERYPAPDGCCDGTATCPDCGEIHTDPSYMDGELCAKCDPFGFIYQEDGLPLMRKGSEAPEDRQ